MLGKYRENNRTTGRRAVRSSGSVQRSLDRRRVIGDPIAGRAEVRDAYRLPKVAIGRSSDCSVAR